MKTLCLTIIAFLLGIQLFSQPVSPSDDFRIKTHEALQEFKKHNKLPGVAFALFDNTNIIITDCLGKSSDGSDITDLSLFSIQSISKNITALAVMIAVEEGLVSLDSSVTRYLPGFKVNSCFEESPEKKITLRLLLSHQAGFTHEAPVGSNYDFVPCENQDHLNSIKETWLKFPVGTNYSYSNLGMDLASEVVASVSGVSFNDYLKTKIFGPASMPSTTTDDREVVLNKNLTAGTIQGLKRKHYAIPLPGSGAVFTDLDDFVRYAQMLMNYGKAGDHMVIDKKFLLQMFTIQKHNYGLGTYLDKGDDISYINHNGGGFGYSATLLWFPEYNIGSVMLSSRPCTTFDFCFSALKDYVNEKHIQKNEAATAMLDSLNGEYFASKKLIDKSQFYSCKCDSAYKPEWDRYVGKYAAELKGMDFRWHIKVARFFGFVFPKIKVFREGSLLKASGLTGYTVLREYEPGLFFTDNNEALDLRNDKPTFRNISLVKR